MLKVKAEKTEYTLVVEREQRVIKVLKLEITSTIIDEFIYAVF